MQAVILAGGKGTRMQELTKELPKPLLHYQNKSLLEWKLERLPDSIDEVIIVIGYLGEKIQAALGGSYKDKKITYVWDKDLGGTAGSLWKAKDILRDNFLVMMGDDLYSQEALQLAADTPWSLIVRNVEREDTSSRIELDQDGNLKNFITSEAYLGKYKDGGQAFTGLYNLGREVFEYPMIKLKNKNEWGLPQTILQMKERFKIITTDSWTPITSPSDLK